MGDGGIGWRWLKDGNFVIKLVRTGDIMYNMMTIVNNTIAYLKVAERGHLKRSQSKKDKRSSVRWEVIDVLIKLIVVNTS